MCHVCCHTWHYSVLHSKTFTEEAYTKRKEKQVDPEYRVIFVHMGRDCKDDIYYCPQIFRSKMNRWASCYKCIHHDTVKGIQDIYIVTTTNLIIKGRIKSRPFPLLLLFRDKQIFDLDEDRINHLLHRNDISINQLYVSADEVKYFLGLFLI